MMKVIATTTWNNCDIVRLFLEYSRAIGFDRSVVMDFDSDDGTADLLRSQAYKDFVTVVPCPGLAGLDSSGLLLEIAKTDYGPDALCLFCDPDEFLVLPEGFGWRQWSHEMCGGIVVPRFNVTGARTAVVADPALASPLGALDLRIECRVRRNPAVDMHCDELTPPWIYTDVPGKVLVRTGRAMAIGDGDHHASIAGADLDRAPPGMYLLHFPLRSYREFEAKVRMNAVDFDANPHLPQEYGWQCRRWVRIAREGRLHDEYMQQFPPDDSIPGMLSAGQLAVDTSVPNLLRAGG